MTEQEQRIAIHRARGLCPHIKTTRYVIEDDDSGFTCDECGRDTYGDKMPDYCNDLNAMHEAEKILPASKRGYYNAELFKLATDRNLSSAVKEPEFIFQALSATAAQRAEAFLRVLGKWKESTTPSDSADKTKSTL